MKKRILLTGDDGYQSIGTRLVLRALGESVDLMIAATKSQMSGVGGHVSLKTGAAWGEDVVDGVKALWVDGYPADVMEFVAGNYPPFDYIISGMNLGANVGPGFPSGTIAAAVHGVALHIALKAIILSWHVGKEHYLRPHDVHESLEAYDPYPLGVLSSVLKKTIATDLWGAAIVNINFPGKATTRARITKPLDNLQTFYEYPTLKDAKTHRFMYTIGELPSSKDHAPEEEVGALMENVIAITPWRKNMFFDEVYNAIEKKDIQL
ncbi:MAG: 5'/3'-nucleotidase SurE [Candidatus Gottesmanbacteria bacterium]|nr:5'/3'-nucleotidase SurE [Candidatus Gottesmanbacteria bacterium]